MKLGVLTNVIGETPLKEALAYFKSLGAQMVEIGCGGYPGKDHCDPGVLLHDEEKFQEFVKTIEESGLEISALSCHGNPIHPNKEIAKQFDDDMRDAVLMAEKLGIHQINCFSGCPGDCPESKNPNWVVCAWPNDYLEVLDYQWNEVLIPYWKDFVAFAKAHGVNKIALEMHQGFCVYNTYTLKKLREAVGPEIGANLDPSHLIWQGMDPIKVIRALGGEAISMSMLRTPRSIPSTLLSTALWIPVPIPTRFIVPGSSAPSATAMTSCSGRISSASCGWWATTTC